jgi:hypothetical protein
MKYATAAVLASSVGVARAGVQGCTGMSAFDAGNYYCGLVNHILYSNVGHAGSYKVVTNMDDAGNCQFSDAAFSGPVAPFNEGVSLALSMTWPSYPNQQSLTRRQTALGPRSWADQPEAVRHLQDGRGTSGIEAE